VRAAASSHIPLISAVGHETDVTLIDFASDKRAPTPTAAAEIAVPVRSELIAELMSKARRALACWQRSQDHRRTELRAATRALPSAEALLAIPRQRLDGCAERLPRALRANAQIHQTQFSRVGGRLSPRLLRTLVERRRERLDACTQRLGSALKTYRETQLHRVSRARDRVTALADRSHRATLALIAVRTARLEQSHQLLRALSYQSVLERGFALVRDDSGHPLRSATAIQPGMALDIEFGDGCVRATANDARSSASSSTSGDPALQSPRKPKRRSGGGSRGGTDQGNLFG
jgi:exodeoxyribonuclease VII large subunit